MNYKYNILWLDDLPIKELDDIKETNPNIYFDKVDYVDVCEAKLSSQTMKYHAVIDIRHTAKHVGRADASSHLPVDVLSFRHRGLPYQQGPNH